MYSITFFSRLALVRSVRVCALMLTCFSFALLRPQSSWGTENSDTLSSNHHTDITYSMASGCLTRSAGYWATHPDQVAGYLVPPLQICGEALDNASVGSPYSAIEALCSTGTDGDSLGKPLAQLIRQCTAAALNVAASRSLGGNCALAYPGIEAEMAACCGNESICTSDPVDDWTIESCVTALDMFNNFQQDTLNFANPASHSDTAFCQAAIDNGVSVLPAP